MKESLWDSVFFLLAVCEAYDFTCPYAPPPVLFADDGFCTPTCVANISDCPAELQADPGYVVCGDGFQYPILNTTDEDDPCNSTFGTIINNCAMNKACGMVVACRRDVNTSSCNYPDIQIPVNTACDYDYEAYVGEVLPESTPAYTFSACFFAISSFLAICYCFFNQFVFPTGKPTLVCADKDRVAEVQASYALETKETQDTTQPENNEELLHKTLTDSKYDSRGYVVETGYSTDIIGFTIFILLVLVAIMFQILLILGVISYYAMGTPKWNPIPNYEQSLTWYITTWHVASIYMVGFLYPKKIRAVFYRRTPLKEANVVEVWTRSQMDVDLKTVGGPWVQKAYYVMDRFFVFFDWFMSTVICYHAKRLRGVVAYCDVTTHPSGMRSFTYQLRQFVYDEGLDAFVPAVVEIPATCHEIIEKRGGLTQEEAERRWDLVGLNQIAVPPPSLLKEFTKEFGRGFYIYQTFMAWTWFNFAYWHMGVLLTFVFTSGGLSIVWVNWNNSKVLATLAGKPNEVIALRDGERKPILSTQLVPGDVIEVEPGENTCDMVLISGKVVLDESSLTGESMPVAKDAVENRAEKFSTQSHKKSVLLAGTITMQGDKQAEPSLAMVLATGGNSEKGVQIRDILFKETPMFKFNYQVKIVVCILGILAVCGGIGTGVMLSKHFWGDGWFYSMYVVASAMPPLLPTVFVVSVGWSANRLLSKKVVCSEPTRLLMAGKVRVCCFDKTGTLTKQGMDFYGVRPLLSGNVLGDHIQDMSTLKDERLVKGMASCQALSKTSTGRLIGTAVDLKMFEASEYELENRDEVDNSGVKVRRDVVTKGDSRMVVVWRFDFDRNRMTMGAVVRDGDRHFVVFKGSAEAIQAICKEVPPNFIPVSEEYASQGCYTLAICSRECTEEETKTLTGNGALDRNEVERHLDFLGFLTFKNEVKPDSAQAIQELRDGAVRVIMITGDHPLTAVKIASELDMLPRDKKVIRATCMRRQAEDSVEWVDQDGKVVDLPEDLNTVELVINGTVFHAIQRSQLMKELLTHVRVFARMSPLDKVAVVQLYIEAGFITAMCGDGGNDCGALRAAHVGIALSDAEASVVSPFTGVSKSAMAVVDVLLEGRCALASAFACYKNVILYGLVETLNQMVNAWYAITFAEWCWVMIDGVWIMSTSFSLATVTPAKKLSQKRPTASPLDMITMCSCIGMFAIHCLFLTVAMGLLKAEPWYWCRQWDIAGAKIGNIAAIGDNYESEVIFLVTGAQFLHSAAAFNFGGKHRDLWIKNWRLAIFLAFYYAWHVGVLFSTSKVSCIYRVNCDNNNALPTEYSWPDVLTIGNPWGTTELEPYFKVKLLIVIIFNGIFACLWEYLVILGPIGEAVRKLKPHTKHLRL